MRIMFLALILALPGAVTPIEAEESTDFGLSIQDRVARFELWNTCGQINLLVESLRDWEIERGLTTEDIATTVRSRLRAARLYGTSGVTSGPYGIVPTLYVNVSASPRGLAFHVRLEFKKQVFDPISGQENLATTWIIGSTGQGDAGYILSWVSRLTDRFIDEYLRVNEPACSRSPIDP